MKKWNIIMELACIVRFAARAFVSSTDFEKFSINRYAAWKNFHRKSIARQGYQGLPSCRPFAT
jgi:hypothetical protein